MIHDNDIRSWISTDPWLELEAGIIRSTLLFRFATFSMARDNIPNDEVPRMRDGLCQVGKGHPCHAADDL